MSYCKTWPNACQNRSTTELTEILVEPKTQDALVFPKQLIDTTVQALIDDAFKSKEIDIPVKKINSEEEMPLDHPFPMKAKLISGRTADTEKALDYFESRVDKHRKLGTDLTPVWVSIGIMAFLFLILIWGILQRVQSLESWLHGRLMSRP